MRCAVIDFGVDATRLRNLCFNRLCVRCCTTQHDSGGAHAMRVSRAVTERMAPPGGHPDEPPQALPSMVSYLRSSFAMRRPTSSLKRWLSRAKSRASLWSPLRGARCGRISST
eukprot:3419075-Rhodomonas_salina.1